VNAESLERINRLADCVGDFIQYWGFKKIHGKVWTHLYLSPDPLDAAELMERLGISKSLASITINDLLHYKVILAKGKGPKDTQVYVANPEVREVILEILKQREASMLEKADSEVRNLSTVTGQLQDPVIDPNRLQSVGRMINEAQLALTAITSLKEVDYSEFKMK